MPLMGLKRRRHGYHLTFHREGTGVLGNEMMGEGRDRRMGRRRDGGMKGPGGGL